MKWTITGKYASGNKNEILGSKGRWDVEKETSFSIRVSRFSELFEQRSYPMMPVPSGRGRDIVEYRLAKDGTGVVMDQVHIHSSKPVKMYFRRVIHDVEINGEPASKEMLEKAVKFLERKHK